MNLKLQYGEISFPADFRFDITANHPFFSNEGSSSIPTTIPATPGNRKILGNPENHNSANCYSRHLQATLSHGVFSKRCRLVVDSASKTGGIMASLALEESEMYAEHQDKKLKNIINTEFVTVENINAISTWLNSHYTAMDDDFVFLKVAADAEDSNNADSTGSTRTASVVLNDSFVNNGSIQLLPALFLLRVPDGRGGTTTISAPAYYSLAPFLKLHALIRKTFEALDYSVKENIFATDAALSTIVVLHNTADSLTNFAEQNENNSYTIAIPYPDMIPSVTVGEFIEWLRNKFGAFVSIKNNEVRIRLLKDILSTPYDHDLSNYLRDEVTVQHPDPVILRIGCQHDIESSEPAAKTLEDLRQAYPSLTTCFSVSEAEGEGLFHILPLGKFYFRNQEGDGLVKVGSDGFDCYREMGVEAEEIISEDLFVPMILHKNEYMPYIGNSVRRHVDIDSKDADPEQKILICYCKNNGTINFGTLYNYDPTGSETTPPTPDLTPEGLTSEYWDAYRRLRMDGAPTLSAKLDIPLHLLASMDICTPKLFQGTKVIIQSIKYSITNSGVSACDVTFLRIKEAVDGAAITDPVFDSNLVWEYVNTRHTYTNVTGSGKKRKGREVIQTDGLTDYAAIDAPAYAPPHPGIIEKKRKRWLRYKEYRYESGGWFLWHWESSSVSTNEEKYYEYFISKNRLSC